MLRPFLAHLTPFSIPKRVYRKNALAFKFRCDNLRTTTWLARAPEGVAGWSKNACKRDMEAGMKKQIKGILAAAVLALGLSGVAKGETITLHNSASSSYGAGIFAYDVTLDAASIANPGDGFVLYDFGGLLSWTITGDVNSSQFNLVQTLTSNALHGNTTPAAGLDVGAAVNASLNGIVPADDPTIANLSFVYQGPPTTLTHSGVDFHATLTILTGATTHLTNAEYASVDQQINPAGGPGATQDSVSFNPIAVAAGGSIAPTPTASLAGGALVGLLGLSRLIKPRRLEA
jgi:hypothetical protein